MLTTEQIEARKAGIGGSDMSAVMGFNPYSSPIDVWLQKTGKAKPSPPNRFTIWGHRLEDVVAQYYAEKKRVKVRRSNKHHQHPEHSILLARIDRLVVGGRKVLECKTASAWSNRDDWGESGTDLVPMSYLIQCSHYMSVLNREEADLAVLIGGNDFRDYTIARDRDIESALIEAANKFWWHVENDTPPPPLTLDDLLTLYPQSKSETVVANEEILDHLCEYNRLKHEVKKSEKRIEEHRLAICAYMGEAECIVDGDGQRLLHWKSSKPSERLDIERLKDEREDVYEDYQIILPGSRRFTPLKASKELALAQ